MSNFTREQIHADWLAGGRISLSDQELVENFNRVAARFGRQWVDDHRISGAVTTWGAAPTLAMATFGQMLASIDGVKGTEQLLARLRRHQADAKAELLGIHLLRATDIATELELEPLVPGAGRRLSDFRLRRRAGHWVYVEVTQPEQSDLMKDVREECDRLTELVRVCSGSFALEVFLRREPTGAQVDDIGRRISVGQLDLSQRAENLPSGVGTLYWNTTEPGTVVLDGHGEPYTPRLGCHKVEYRDGIYRHIVVRWPYTDERVANIIRVEARQLSREAPGLIVIQTQNAIGAMKAWRNLIGPRFTSNQHTRVSAVALVKSLQTDVNGTETWRPAAKIIVNPYARHPIPRWVQNQLDRFPSDEPDIP